LETAGVRRRNGASAHPDWPKRSGRHLGLEELPPRSVGDRDQVRSAANDAIRVFGKIHILCNNAGIGGGGNAEDPDFDAVP